MRGLARVTARDEEQVTKSLRDLLYALQVDAGPARENTPWSALIERMDAWHNTLWHVTESLIQVSRRGKWLRLPE